MLHYVIHKLSIRLWLMHDSCVCVVGMYMNLPRVVVTIDNYVLYVHVHSQIS